MKSNARKPFIIPGSATLMQIGRNMAKRENAADWKHYPGYSVFALKYPLGIARRPEDKR